jgi:PIN domain nuclease of toxin-antitoxin system
VTLLLDTHTWIFSLLEPDRLSPTALEALGTGALLLSPISVWEALLLCEKGRLDLRPEPLTWVRNALLETPADMAPLTHSIAAASRALPDFPNEDPADRFLVATALEQGATLVTKDRHLRRYKRVRTLW